MCNGTVRNSSYRCSRSFTSGYVRIAQGRLDVNEILHKMRRDRAYCILSNKLLTWNSSWEDRGQYHYFCGGEHHSRVNWLCNVPRLGTINEVGLGGFTGICAGSNDAVLERRWKGSRGCDESQWNTRISVIFSRIQIWPL